ncbi:MAG: hypothetical protein OHK0021_17280 [Bryobacter sp.]
MTYARARLWLGISGVGTMVLLCLAGLIWSWPSAVFNGWGTDWAEEAAGLALIVLAYSLLHVPIDYIGGYWLPCYFSRQCLIFSMWAAQYIRAILFQSMILLTSAVVILEAGQWGGRAAALAAIAAWMLLMVELQDRLAVWVAGLYPESKNGVLYLGGMDAGFAGGLAGLPGRERIVMPSLWQRLLPAHVLEVEMTRRRAARGSRMRGLLVAVVFNLSGFWACSYFPGAGVTNLAELLTTALGFTLWSFVGLLILPTISRWGVFELDQAARNSGYDRQQFEAVVREIDQLQDDEPSRPRGVETIFHPVPSVERRLEVYEKGWGAKGAWNAARYALYLSWPCMGFLSRAVHCNSGRPELWVMLPVD